MLTESFTGRPQHHPKPLGLWLHGTIRCIWALCLPVTCHPWESSTSRCWTRQGRRTPQSLNVFCGVKRCMRVVVTATDWTAPCHSSPQPATAIQWQCHAPLHFRDIMIPAGYVYGLWFQLATAPEWLFEAVAVSPGDLPEPWRRRIPRPKGWDRRWPQEAPPPETPKLPPHLTPAPNPRALHPPPTPPPPPPANPQTPPKREAHNFGASWLTTNSGTKFRNNKADSGTKSWIQEQNSGIARATSGTAEIQFGNPEGKFQEKIENSRKNGSSLR